MGAGSELIVMSRARGPLLIRHFIISALEHYGSEQKSAALSLNWRQAVSQRVLIFCAETRTSDDLIIAVKAKESEGYSCGTGRTPPIYPPTSIPQERKPKLQVIDSMVRPV